MGPPGKCSVCDSLKDEAAAAINRHIQVTGRRELARLRHDHEIARALDIVVNEAAAARGSAVNALRQHLDWHRQEGAANRAAKETGASGSGD